MPRGGGKVSDRIGESWQELQRSVPQDQDGFVGLPYPYVVPGGMFQQQFYWDSYFIMLGLAADKKWDLIEGMLQNQAFMIKKFGFIPTANHENFLSRSQPPFFSHAIKLLAQHKGRKTLVEYLPALLMEYRFWMRGHTKVRDTQHKAYKRVVKMPNGLFLNRYYDEKMIPRPESNGIDNTTAQYHEDRQPDKLFLHLRAAAESGWDFSSRWLLDASDLGTVHTADIVPVDLNCLLYHLESTIAHAYQLLRDEKLTQRFQKAADRRRKAIDTYFWDENTGFYEDFNFHHGQSTGQLTLAALFPLYVKIASAPQAASIARRVERDFLKAGGLVTSLVETGQQWDAPNGWAPLQWVAIQGLRNYGYHRLANEIKRRWIKTNLKIFYANGKLVEKYNVIDTDKLGQGGEYPLQDGFGWTNGVLAALLAE